MRGKKAKALRKKVYGDRSQRASERVYALAARGRVVINVITSPRAIYQQTKRGTA